MSYAPVPAPSNPDKLKSYLDDELRRIAESLNRKITLAYGGLLQTSGPTPIPLTPTPIAFAPYDAIIPVTSVPWGVEVELSDGSFTVLTGGDFLIHFFSLDANVGNNVSYNFEPYLNGVGVGVVAGIDPSNQTSRAPVSLQSIVRLAKGDKVQIFADSPSSSTWDAAGSRFMLHRISQEFEYEV